MSILSYINDPIPLILIGGNSGIGKTSIIDSLLNDFPDVFEQPISYTTREKRDENDNYNFISKEEIHQLYNTDMVYNLDYVYGNYYAISKDSKERITQNGRIPIKEVHPDNFIKFKTRYPDTITIIIENKHNSYLDSPFIQRGDRINEDFKSQMEYCDFILNISGLSPNGAAQILIKKVIAHKIHTSLYPHPNIIDDYNKRGYDDIADEFTDTLRITTKNFHDASTSFWRDFFAEIATIQRNLEILELGSGNGWLMNNLNPSNCNITGVDISEKMKASYCSNLFNCSVRNIPVKADHFDFVVGSLIDPLISPETFIEIERVLKKDGVFILTTPSYEWASNMGSRLDVNQTNFKKQSGTNVKAYSFCNSLLQHLLISKISALVISQIDNLRLGEKYNETVSEAIIESSINAGHNFLHFPIVTAIRFKKIHYEAF